MSLVICTSVHYSSEPNISILTWILSFFKISKITLVLDLKIWNNKYNSKLKKYILEKKNSEHKIENVFSIKFQKLKNVFQKFKSKIFLDKGL